MMKPAASFTQRYFALTPWNPSGGLGQLLGAANESLKARVTELESELRALKNPAR